MRFLICIDFLMNLVKQSFKETLWFSQPLQDSPGEILVFDWGESRMVGEVGFETQRDSSLSAWPSAGISISSISLCEGDGGREVDDALNLGFLLYQLGTENPSLIRLL